MRYALGCVALIACMLTGGSRSAAQPDLAAHVRALIAGLDCDEARGELAGGDVDDPAIAVERARLAIYELDCDGAAAILSRPDLQKSEAGEQLADIARGCQRVMAALPLDRDEARGIEVRWQDEHDRALAPLLFETVSAARESLTRDLGVDWPRPTRVVVVRDLLSLSAMTGLPYKSAQTTGTVAVAKWGRVTLLSPRASKHGYGWRDTVAHELTHLAVTRASGDRAPLWLQEGVAKLEEVRWRGPGPFDDRPPVDGVVRRGQELKLVLPFDRLGPSIAMLPSADAAMVAFAEVTSLVRFFAQEEGAEALPRLLAELKRGRDTDDALRAASGTDLKGWDARWRTYIAARPSESLPTLSDLGLEEHDDENAAHGGKSSKRDPDKWKSLREHSRLAELLLARNHPNEALAELDRIELSDAALAPEDWEGKMKDPSVRWLRARAFEGAGKREMAAPLVGDASQVLASYGPWWATRGRWARARGDEATAATSFREAVSWDPFNAESACEAIDPVVLPADPSKIPLCEAARAFDEEPFDAD